MAFTEEGLSAAWSQRNNSYLALHPDDAQQGALT